MLFNSPSEVESAQHHLAGLLTCASSSLAGLPRTCVPVTFNLPDSRRLQLRGSDGLSPSSRTPDDRVIPSGKRLGQSGKQELGKDTYSEDCLGQQSKTLPHCECRPPATALLSVLQADAERVECSLVIGEECVAIAEPDARKMGVGRNLILAGIKLFTRRRIQRIKLRVRRGIATS